LCEVHHHIEVCTGRVAQEIVDHAKMEGFDLIVLGAKGRGAVACLLLGSVAHRVLTKIEMPLVSLK
jgi:nucleotide-binding universal stress UspA family protein